MIVVDASAIVEVLVGRDVHDDLLDAVSGDVAAPHLIDTEVLSVLRGLVLGHKLSAAEAQSTLVDFFDLQIVRYKTAPLANRIWSLRHRFTSYDATYLALAEALDAPVHTCDAKLDSEGHRADIRLHSPSR